jgi:hypothetical protein
VIVKRSLYDVGLSYTACISMYDFVVLLLLLLLLQTLSSRLMYKISVMNYM